MNDNFKEFSDYIINNYSEKIVNTEADESGSKHYFLPLNDDIVRNLTNLPKVDFLKSVIKVKM